MRYSVHFHHLVDEYKSFADKQNVPLKFMAYRAVISIIKQRDDTKREFLITCLMEIPEREWQLLSGILQRQKERCIEMKGKLNKSTKRFDGWFRDLNTLRAFHRSE